MSDRDELDEFDRPEARHLPLAAVETYRPARWDAPAATPVAAVRQRHERALLATRGVTGVGMGPSRNGAEAILVYVLDEATARSLPASLEGVPVEAVVTGPIVAR